MPQNGSTAAQVHVTSKIEVLFMNPPLRFENAIQLTDLSKSSRAVYPRGGVRTSIIFIFVRTQFFVNPHVGVSTVDCIVQGFFERCWT